MTINIADTDFHRFRGTRHLADTFIAQSRDQEALGAYASALRIANEAGIENGSAQTRFFELSERIAAEQTVPFWKNPTWNSPNDVSGVAVLEAEQFFKFEYSAENFGEHFLAFMPKNINSLPGT